MVKNLHEIRDPIHVFVRYDSDERLVINSRPFQRLRHIHQLALSSQVYPSASHKRFEHSLGVMELAGRVFDVVTQEDRITDQIRKVIPEISPGYKRDYWRRVLRMAALCHDIGHLPFSHAAEKELLPDGFSHEDLTRDLILSEEMNEIWQGMTPQLRSEEIAKLALGPQKWKDGEFTTWETILSEIIVGDAFGVDRMDYLLRDSYHLGVPYGKFDHFRLIDTLCILPDSPTEKGGEPGEPALGVITGGIHSAEALLLARYFMFSQVYFHPIRRIYDIHLMDFLKLWLPDGKFSTDLEKHLSLTDNEVWAALLKASRDSKSPGHEHARKIVYHDHFHLLYSPPPADIAINSDAGKAVYEAACNKFGEEFIRHDKHTQSSGVPNFPVSTRDERIASSISMSDVLQTLPVAKFDYVFISPHLLSKAGQWLEGELEKIIQPEREAGS